MEVLKYFRCEPTGCELQPALPKGGEIYVFGPVEDEVKKGELIT